MNAPSSESTSVLLVPGLLCTPRLYAEQLPALWRFGPVFVADHTRDDSVAAIARRALSQLAGRFALVGLSMGGYVALEILRQAPSRVAKLALLDTTARPDLPEQTENRRRLVEVARGGRFAEIPDVLYPKLVAPAREQDAALRAIVRTMVEETGADAFARQQAAISARPDSRPSLATIRCPTLVLVGAEDALTPPDRATEMAEAIPGARLVTVPDCGHLSTLERPEPVTRALVELLER